MKYFNTVKSKAFKFQHPSKFKIFETLYNSVNIDMPGVTYLSNEKDKEELDKLKEKAEEIDKQLAALNNNNNEYKLISNIDKDE